ncbi:MAG: NYN domain-containing protein [Candidatus Staskawiczbacteria bacterium]|nr:NYN domain-containing protein [Candidatus Staskawiczbacteria bacterium]
MDKKENNYAYIDGANLHRGVIDFGWKLDYRRFRVWLSDKYSVKKAHIFIGLIPKYKDLYKYLQDCGFILVFKEVVYDGDGKAKGNCDADLVLQTVCDVYENKFDKAIIVSSDGDYASLVKFIEDRGKLRTILSPHNKDLCSILLKRINVPIAYLNDQRLILQAIKEKTPDADRTT